MSPSATTNDPQVRRLLRRLSTAECGIDQARLIDEIAGLGYVGLAQRLAHERWGHLDIACDCTG